MNKWIGKDGMLAVADKFGLLSGVRLEWLRKARIPQDIRFWWRVLNPELRGYEAELVPTSTVAFALSAIYSVATVMPSLRYGFAELKVRSRSAQGTVTLSSRYVHNQLMARSRSAQGTVTISSRYRHAQHKVRSRSAQGTFTASSRHVHDQLKVRSR